MFCGFRLGIGSSSSIDDVRSYAIGWSPRRVADVVSFEGVLRLVSHGVPCSRVRSSVYCVDTRAGEILPRPYGDAVHGTAPGEVVHFDFLYVGSSGPERREGLPEEDRFRYILVIMDDLYRF